MEYRVISDADLAQLIHTVNARMNDGWRLVGGIATTFDPKSGDAAQGSGSVVFLQAIVRE